VGKGALLHAVPTGRRPLVGTLRFAHPTTLFNIVRCRGDPCDRPVCAPRAPGRIGKTRHAGTFSGCSSSAGNRATTRVAPTMLRFLQIGWSERPAG